LIAIDQNITKTVAITEVRKDTTISATASVKFDGLPLSFNSAPFVGDSAYSTVWNSAIQFAQGNHTLKISDSTSLSSQSISLSLPGTVSIIGVTPSNRLSNGSNAVKLDWFGGAERAVLSSPLYAPIWRTLVRGIQSMLPRRRLRRPSRATLSIRLIRTRPTTGWYYLYVYAYTGAPDSVFAKDVLPIGFPSQLAENVSSQYLKGHARNSARRG